MDLRGGHKPSPFSRKLDNRNKQNLWVGKEVTFFILNVLLLIIGTPHKQTYAIVPIINGTVLKSRNYSIYAPHVVRMDHGTECFTMIYVLDRLQDRVIPLYNINKQEINAVIVR